MEVDAVTPDVAQELELPRGQGGAIVTRVERNSPAANAGLFPNDVILEGEPSGGDEREPGHARTAACGLGRHGLPARLARREQVFVPMTKR